MVSNRNNDVKGEQTVSKLLDKTFYSNYSFVRNRNKDFQKKGIDIIISHNNETLFCDEKCALDYINKELRTFAFELRTTSDSNGQRHDGWLLSNYNLTTHYNLIYITKCKVDKNPTSDDIEEVEIIIVSKESVKNYIKSLGWTKEMLSKKCDNIDSRQNGQMGNIYKDGIKFVKSEHKFESPINVLIPKEKLIEISLKHEIIKTT